MQMSLVVEVNVESKSECVCLIRQVDFPAVPRIGETVQLTDDAPSEVVDVVWQLSGEVEVFMEECNEFEVDNLLASGWSRHSK